VKYGVKPLSVTVVVCGDELECEPRRTMCALSWAKRWPYGSQIWGDWSDTNGNHGPPRVDGTSIALATALHGKEVINSI